MLAPIARASARLSADELIAYRAEVEALLAEPDLPEVDRQLLAARLREAEAERSPEPTDLRLPAA